VITLQNVSLSYGGAPVISGIDATFAEKGFTCLIGKNGSGKSTLLRAAAGMIPYAGTITLGGKELRGLPRKERARHIAYLPQTRLVAAMDVETLIAHGRYPHLGFSKTLTAKDRELVKAAAEAAGVKDLLRRDLPTLSGGERQRAYIAMMLAQNADMMLLDEPTAHLDIEYQIEIMELLNRLRRTGKTVVMAAHDLPQAFHYATGILLLGKATAFGTPESLCDSPRIETEMGVRIIKDSAGGLYRYKLEKPSKAES
jgi:iron complex transport system ATP-binding protein